MRMRLTPSSIAGRLAVFTLTAGMVVGILVGVAGPAHADTKLDLRFGAPTRTVIDSGNPGSSVGDMTITTGDVLDPATGRRLGYYTTNQVTVRADAATGREIRRNDLSVSLAKGTIFAAGLIRATAGTPPTRSMEFAVVGGTGAYQGARGSLTHGAVAEQATFPVSIRLLSGSSQ